MVPVTDSPYAVARLLDVRNASTSTITAANSIQLIDGT